MDRGGMNESYDSDRRLLNLIESHRWIFHSVAVRHVSTSDNIGLFLAMDFSGSVQAIRY